MAIPIPSTNYAKLARELVVNPRIFFGLCCKDWGTHGDLRYVSCRGHWCSQALILIEATFALSTLVALSEYGDIHAQHMSHTKRSFTFQNYLLGVKRALPAEPIHRAERLRRAKRAERVAAKCSIDIQRPKKRTSKDGDKKGVRGDDLLFSCEPYPNR
ncbi:hypothetical protein JHK87_039640 [Glycine soja]|nr:hypothetical protein JHK87_039640 [Glycine soja]